MNYLPHKILIGSVLTVIISEIIGAAVGSVVELSFILKSALLSSFCLICMCELACFKSRQSELTNSNPETDLN